MKIEVLVSTMNQSDNNLIKKMNIRTDAIIINQCKHNKYEEIYIEDKKIRIFCINEKGLSKSRNQALLLAKGDICLIADDDMTYVDDYEEIVMNAFREIPEADIIVFNTTMINYKGSIERSSITKIRNAPKYKNYGSVRMAFRKSSFVKNNIWFNTLFGAGSIFGAGEESLVIRDAVRSGLRIYEYPGNIASVDYSTSTWFEGYNEKYFYNKGAFLEKAYPNLKYIFKYYYLVRMRKCSNISRFDMLKWMKYGFEGFKLVKSYEEYTLSLIDRGEEV